MEPSHNPPPGEKKPINWPIAVNLGILVLVFIVTGGGFSMVTGALPILLVINGVAAIIMKISGKISWFFAFLLSILVLLLIGLGICALLVQGN